MAVRSVGERHLSSASGLTGWSRGEEKQFFHASEKKRILEMRRCFSLGSNDMSFHCVRHVLR